MFGFGSGAESTTIQVPESTTLFVPSGTAEPVIRTQTHQGSGTQFITGVATDTRTRSHVGSGSLFSAGGLSEAVAVSEAKALLCSVLLAEKKCIRQICNRSRFRNISELC